MHVLTPPKQISRRALGNLLPLRRQSDRLRQRGRASGTAERIPQIAHAGGGGDAGVEDAEAGYGGEAGLEECTAGECDQGEGV